jgi:hypothetical protein
MPEYVGRGTIAATVKIDKNRLAAAVAYFETNDFANAAAKSVMSTAKALAPKQTGAMASTIRVIHVNQHRSDVYVGGAPLIALADTDYPRFVEEGWRRHPAPEPFMAPATEMVAHTFPVTYTPIMISELEAVVGT